MEFIERPTEIGNHPIIGLGEKWHETHQKSCHGSGGGSLRVVGASITIVAPDWVPAAGVR